MARSQDDDISEFVSPFLKNGRSDETVLVTPKEPGRNKKVYLIKRETGLTGQNYVQCSSCNHRAFRMFRTVSRSSLPSHLHGNTNAETLKFCRSCWYDASSKSPNDNPEMHHLSCVKNNNNTKSECDKRVPYFERGPLGITDQRACFSWHFLQRDFVQKKAVGCKERNGMTAEKLPLVCVLGQDGNDFVKRENKASLFYLNGKEVTLNDKMNHISNDNTSKDDELSNSLSDLLINIQKDHNYAPMMQNEIEVKTTDKSPVKNVFQQNCQKSNGTILNNEHKCDKNKKQICATAKKLLKKAVNYEMHPKEADNLVTSNLSASKLKEGMKLKNGNGQGPNPNHLMGLKATAENGQTLPGLICPLCGRHTVKSYSVWKKEKAPEKIQHLFKGGVTVIRACRKCVPYPPNREKKSSHASLEILSAQNQSSFTNKKQQAKEMHVSNGLDNASSSCKGQMSRVKVETSKVKKNDLIMVNVGVKVARVTTSSHERVKNGRQKRTSGEKEDDMIRKKARIEERKRKIKIANGGELTGLECFESLQSEEKINNGEIAEDQNDGNWLLCNEVQSNITQNEFNSKGRPAKGSLPCDKCHGSLGKTFKTIKQSKCPKRFSYFFKQNKNRRSMRVCKNCTKK